MGSNNKMSSSDIFRGMIQKSLNPVIEMIIGFMFRKMEIDRESLKTLKEVVVEPTLQGYQCHYRKVNLK